MDCSSQELTKLLCWLVVCLQAIPLFISRSLFPCTFCLICLNASISLPFLHCKYTFSWFSVIAPRFSNSHTQIWYLWRVCLLSYSIPSYLITLHIIIYISFNIEWWSSAAACHSSCSTTCGVSLKNICVL